jgi:predicted AAA+ superfamily ATPase
MSNVESMDEFFARVGTLLDRVELLVPAANKSIDWTALSYRWRKTRVHGYLQPVTTPHRIEPNDLQRIDRQRREIDRNTRQFVLGLPANNVLLTGSRGTGKSSLVKAMLSAYAESGLRLIEVDKSDLIDLVDIVEHVEGRDERYIIFCDDLSFEGDESSYKALKAILDGSISAPPENVLIYATSNRRHLMPEYMQENGVTRSVNGEIHHAEAVEEKISLSERFGLWLSFYPFDQSAYLEIVYHWIAQLGMQSCNEDHVRADALKWAMTRGSRSGRSAHQFARDWVGRQGLTSAGRVTD